MDAKTFSLKLKTVPEDIGAPREARIRPQSSGQGTREAHLDDGLLDRGLAPAVALDDGHLEGDA